MMTSNFVSQWRGSNNTAASIYETLRQHDDDSGFSDIEDRAGLAVDQRNLQDEFRDMDPNDSRLDPGSNDARQRTTRDNGDARRSTRPRSRRNIPRRTQRGHKQPGDEFDEVDDDVPASLLIEGHEALQEHGSLSLPPPPSLMAERNSVPGVTNRQTQEQWDRTRTQPDARAPRNTRGPPQSTAAFSKFALADPRQKAMWHWTNVMQLDNFLFDVYQYYLDHGFWSTILSRLFNLITVAFVVGFSLFLTQCIDYRTVKGSTEMSQILVARCTSKMGLIPNLLLWIVTFAWISKFFLHLVDIRRLTRIHDFYLYCLDISENEIQSISWQEIVSRLMVLRDSHPDIRPSTSAKARRYMSTQSKQRMDAHDIANRLMRRENYMIAMVNKDLLDMTLPVPFLRNRPFFTKVLEWNLEYCIMDYVFNEKGQIRTLFLKDTHRKMLAEGLRQRFLFAGTLNLVIAPPLILFFLLQNFFQYFNEYQRNPAQIGSRQYSPLAEWKFREFNELRHLFQRRINMSYPFATRYINQFPKDKTVQFARLVTFISGALVSVLGLATVLDQDSFLGFEITPGRTTIFYLGLFGGVWAVARGLLPDDNLVYEPAFSMQEVIDFTHYEPSHWQGRLHSVEVKTEFAQLYPMKISIILQEVLSMVFTPFILWFSLPKCSERIIDFFREFTVHVDGIGYVCSFAEFKLKKAKPMKRTENQHLMLENGVMDAPGLTEDYFATKDQKLEQSYWGFMNDYARNPKTEVRFPYGNARRRFHLPPPLPGLLSPPLEGAEGQHQTGQRPVPPGSVFLPSRAIDFNSGTPKFLTQNLVSPLQSVLLDPHHQPSASGLGGSPRAMRPRTGLSAPGIVKGLRRTIDHPADVAEEGLQTGDLAAERSAQSRGELGSWKYEDEEEEVSEDEDINAVAAEGVGILGLVKQFQKAQGEGHRTGI